MAELALPERETEGEKIFWLVREEPPLPDPFTEEGILRLSHELHSKIAELKRQIEKHDEEIQAIFEVIYPMIKGAEKPARRIGFHAE